MFERFQTDFFPNISKELNVSSGEAEIIARKWFGTKTLVIQPIGLQGKVYNGMRYAQNVISAVYVTETISAARIAGVTGFQLVQSSPLTAVGASYLGSVFFGYCACAAGDNFLGSAFNASSYLLSRPMWAVETTLNGLVLKPLSYFTGVPLLLNGTQALFDGKGLTVKEYAKIAMSFERVSNSTFIKKLKKIYTILKQKN